MDYCHHIEQFGLHHVFVDPGNRQGVEQDTILNLLGLIVLFSADHI